MASAIRQDYQINCLWVLLLFGFIWATPVQAAPPPLSIKSAVYNKKAASLIVKTQVKESGGLLTLLHSQGGVLGQTGDSEHVFKIPLSQLGEVPCQVEARIGELSVRKAVAGAAAECKKAPLCKILAPANPASTNINVPTNFEAQVALKDKKAAPLTIEWDFAGGVMGHPYQKLLKDDGSPVLKGTVSSVATFVRDNSQYRVRFAAMDAKGRRCEASVNVNVGNPPTDLPDALALNEMVKTSQLNAPEKGQAMQKPEGSLVVLPYQDWTMQTATDARTAPNVYLTFSPPINNINATVYEKARKPPVVGPDRVELLYSAAVNPADPVGPHSINSTSQNWPLEAPLQQATVQKCDYFETYTRPVDAILAEGYTSYSFVGFLSPALATAADEGYHNPNLSPPLNPEHGRYMPGITVPYTANEPQPFSQYVDNDGSFAAQMLPLTDIDDKGRVNTAPLFRIEARDTGSDTANVKTDLAVSASRDFHCRECHAKGKMAANSDLPKSWYQVLNFYDPDSDSLADQEYAAIKNTTRIHPGPDTYTGRMNSADEVSDKVIANDGPAGCGNADDSCHTSAITTTAFGKPLGDRAKGGRLATIMHFFHGLFQYNANKDDVVRYDFPGVKGSVKRFSHYNDWDAKSGSLPNSLFPVKDKDGKILPMEENCLKCHGGMREQCYRDRMYTAGVTCYQCHGDMLAVSGLFGKSTPGADGSTTRQPWIDQPDCAACHTGNANRGKTSSGGFFSAGVMRTAFDEADRTATPRQVDRLNPDAVRFAVPITAMELGNSDIYSPNPDGSYNPFITKTPLYRVGKDNHGQVPCGACHGAAHAIWPNRDPNANDNVTALQLQGHAGPIAECSVCHTADSFAKFEDLDEGIKAVDPKEGVLGGPHNMHPINDPNWWQGAAADVTPNQTSGKTKGGWHNDYAKSPGRLGEDQCAACHGNDHLGTRLSKTPVDREFVTAKGKKLKVKAGKAIGCNLCHTVDKSCTGSPSGADCGIASEKVTLSANQAPLITSSSDTTVVLGEDYQHVVNATDPEGGKLSYQLKEQTTGVNIDANTGVIMVPARSIEEMAINASSGAATQQIYLYQYYVVVSDEQGAQTTQLVRIAFDCPSGLLWDTAMHNRAYTPSCVKVTLTSMNPINGLNGGETYRYPVIAKQRSGVPLSYNLSGQPQGMTINSDTGLIEWKTPDTLNVFFKFSVTASNSQGDTAQQEISLSVCSAPQHWDQQTANCLGGPIQFTSYPNIAGITAGETYTYPVKAKHDNNLPLTYSLAAAPAGMSINASSGLINWVAQASMSGPIDFTVSASDGLGGATYQTWNVNVCAFPEHWGTEHGACQSPIEFTSNPPYGVDVGQTYSYQVTTTHTQGLPLTYRLADLGAELPRPAGMTINANTGLISWLVQEQAVTDGYFSFRVIATDSNGYTTPQDVSVQVCVPPGNWSNELGYCRGAVRITSTQPRYGLDVGQTFTYQVIATEAVPEGLPITYSLDYVQPEGSGLSIDPVTGLMTWVAVEDPNNPGYSELQFQITAADTQGQQESQFGYLTVCTPPLHYINTPDSQGCQ